MFQITDFPSCHQCHCQWHLWLWRPCIRFQRTSLQKQARGTETEVGRPWTGRYEKRAAIFIIFSQVQSRRNLKPSELESVKSIQFINSVKVFVDPLTYKQVISYHKTPMLPLGCIRGRRRNWWRQWRGQSPMYDANYSLKLWRQGRTGIETNAVKTARKKDRWMFGNRMPWESPWYFYWERYLSTCRQGKQASKWRCHSERLLTHTLSRVLLHLSHTWSKGWQDLEMELVIHATKSALDLFRVKYVHTPRLWLITAAT